MIEILLIRGNDAEKIATIKYLHTNDLHCGEIVEAIVNAIHGGPIVSNRIADDKYPIAYNISYNTNYKVVARDINE